MAQVDGSPLIRSHRADVPFGSVTPLPWMPHVAFDGGVMGISRRYGLVGLMAVALGLVGGCTSGQQAGQVPPTSSPSSPTASESPLSARISVPTWDWTPQSPMEANQVLATLTDQGGCAVVGDNPYSAAVFPQGWYARKNTDGSLTIYAANDREWATTGSQVTFSGGSRVPSKGEHACLSSYPTMTLIEAIAP
jgi:hypothetical protein